MREAFEQYLNTSNKAGKLLMNATRQALYLRFLSDPDQKIVEADKYEKSRLYTEKRRAINEFCIDNKGQLLHVGLKKGDITRPQAFVYGSSPVWSNSCIVHRPAEVRIGRPICSQTSWVYRTLAGMVKYLYSTPARPIYLTAVGAYRSEHT